MQQQLQETEHQALFFWTVQWRSPWTVMDIYSSSIRVIIESLVLDPRVFVASLDAWIRMDRRRISCDLQDRWRSTRMEISWWVTRGTVESKSSPWHRIRVVSAIFLRGKVFVRADSTRRQDRKSYFHSSRVVVPMTSTRDAFRSDDCIITVDNIGQS